MRDPLDPKLPDDLRMVEERLRSGRVKPSPLDLDRLKRRVLAQAARRHERPRLIWSRLVAAATAVVLLAGAGGALALSGLDSHPNSQGGAADHQYKHPKYCTHGNPPPGQRCKGLAANGTLRAYGARKQSKRHHHHHHTTHHRKRHRASRRPKHGRGFTG